MINKIVLVNNDEIKFGYVEIWIPEENEYNLIVDGKLYKNINYFAFPRWKELGFETFSDNIKNFLNIRPLRYKEIKFPIYFKIK